ncbi:fungal specific transcription factor [Aspergillus sclerotialis]|uniref:Fungal specific transcription factor n=1 Tax=Aspergillus sclerotialis TaxID=2070753 RepID=A0A3A2ZAT5_9EURO|nr:fungal specific transcription factor [Aspergillus sclerotialis]
MRSSLSCEFCRRSKIKCVNAGRAPCRKCERSGITGCILSRPGAKNRTPLVHCAQQPRHPTSPCLPSGHEADSSNIGPFPPVADVPVIHGPSQGNEKQRINDHIASLSPGVIVRIMNTFSCKFPELGMLHPSSFIEGFRQSYSIESQSLLAAVLAATGSQVSYNGFASPQEFLTEEQYASFAREILAESCFKPPKLQVAQALLVMAIYEWGSREFHRAWMYSGNSIRIMQAIHSSRVTPYLPNPPPGGENDSVSIAIENRTLWSCFIIDRMISAGAYNPPMLPVSEMEKLKISRPLNTVDFAFGGISTSQAGSLEWNLSSPLDTTARILDITCAFEILTTGFDIWADVMTFVLNDGRRAPGMCAAQNCPWVPGSPWSKTKYRLEAWRASQHSKLYYPNNGVMAHTFPGSGESFTYINLLYYICTLMLHREYFPFLPDQDSGPVGPVDHPKLQAEAPQGWWETSAHELFSATGNIAKILHEASECGAEVLTPFAGFCAFSAAYMNLYVLHFPQINLGRSPNAQQNLNTCLEYLEAFRMKWKLGESYCTTIKHALIVYQRATANNSRSRYQGKSRRDFDHLHQSIHEFRVLDRSEQHLREIEGAEKEAAPNGGIPPETNADAATLGLDMPLTDMLNEVSTYAHEQSMWSLWWPSIDEVNQFWV